MTTTPSVATTTHPVADQTPTGGLRTPHLLLLIVAAAAPLGVAVGNLPSGMILGNGPGLPSVFLAAGLVIGCLSVGYVAMNRAVPDGTGFTGFVHAGLGRGAGLGTAYATALSYWAGSLSLAAGFGYFGSLIAAAHGLTVPWWALSLAGFALVQQLGRRAAELSATVLVALMLAEVSIVVTLDVLILSEHGMSALPLAVFSPTHALSGNLGPALLTGFTSYIGVESGLLYTRETRRPDRSVPRATYLAIGFIAVLYVATAWLVVGALGVGDAVATATSLQGDLVFALAAQQGGTFFLTLVQIFFVTSLLACLVALHNAAARYAQTLGSTGALPARFGARHPRFGAPAFASDVMAAVGALLFVLFAVLGTQPYIGLGTSLTGVFTLGIVAVQGLVAVSIVVRFRRARDARLWATLIAPTLGGVGVTAASIAIVANYPVLTGSSSPAGRLVPLVLVAALVAGPVVARRRPGLG